MKRIAVSSPTAHKDSQRLVNSVSAWKIWKLLIADISTAFLQGLTFEQLSELTGCQIRDVSFSPPEDVWQHIDNGSGGRCSPAMSGTHLLRMLKAGYGLNDAPRLWRLKLD